MNKFICDSRSYDGQRSLTVCDAWENEDAFAGLHARHCLRILMICQWTLTALLSGRHNCPARLVMASPAVPDKDYKSSD
jgi:hypothetical protein